MCRRRIGSLLMVCLAALAGCSLLQPDMPIPISDGSGFVGLQANLMAQYTFSGSPADASRWGNHGELRGPSFVADRHGSPDSALWFDGDDDHVIILSNESLEILGPITLSAWVFPEERKSQIIVAKGSRVRIDTGSGSLQVFHPYGLSLSATGDIIFSLSPDLQPTQVRKHGYATNAWFHIAGVYDGDSMRLYVGGELVASEPVSGVLAGLPDPLLIGTRLGLPSSTFRGVIDEVHIYDRALTEAEIEQLAR